MSRSATRRSTRGRRTAAALALALAAALLGGAGCGLSLKQSREDFVQSSLDFNHGHVHSARLAGRDLDHVADRVIALGRARELTLVKQTPCRNSARCSLVFRSKPIDRRVFRAGGSLTLVYYSRFFVTLARAGAATQVEIIGLPVLDGRMACPRAQARRIGCKVQRLTRHRGTTLVDSVRREWGYDVSGQGEAETAQGLLAELQRGPAALATAASGRAAAAAKRHPVIVAVFDIADDSKTLTRRTLAQLSEYLMTKITELAGYQVVPRDRLRKRLAREKKKSYRLCYDQRCQIELGKALSAEKSLATKLIRIGKQCALTAVLYDLGRETSERAASTRTACTSEALLGGIDRLTQRLATATPGSTPSK